MDPKWCIFYAGSKNVNKNEKRSKSDPKQQKKQKILKLAPSNTGDFYGHWIPLGVTGLTWNTSVPHPRLQRSALGTVAKWVLKRGGAGIHLF